MNHVHHLRGFACSIVVTLIAMASTQPVSAQVFFSDQFSFEEFGPGTAIVDSNGVGIIGFTGTPDDSTLNAAEVTAETPPAPPNNYPIVDATHTSVVSVLGDVQRLFTSEPTSSRTNFVYVDTMIQPGLLALEPAVPDGAQIAAYFNTNGQLVIRHAVYSNDCTSVNRLWTELTHTPVASNDWVRLTMCLNYVEAGIGFNPSEHYFTISLNGQILAHPLAYVDVPITPADCAAPNVPVPAGPGQTNHWFGMADSLFGAGGPENQPNNAFFSSIEYSGLGKIDDLVVTGSGQRGTTSTTSTSSSTSTAGGGPSPFEEWVQQFNLGAGNEDPEDDPDGDGATNCEEWNAGTDPSDASNVFEITAIQKLVGANRVTWQYGTNTTITTPFSVWRSTDLSVSGMSVIESGIVRDGTGQQSYDDTNTTSITPEYRIVIDPDTTCQ